MSRVKLVEEELRFKFYYKGQFCLGYNKGCLQWGDFYLSRPNFFPVYSPSGRLVTTSCAHRYNHHKSIFIGHAKVNGINFFHDNNPTRADLGDIALESAESEITDAGVVLRTLNSWTTKEGVCMLEEQRDVVWRPGDQVHVLDVASTLISRVGDVTFAKDKHAFFGIRVADTIDVEDGGRVVNSMGQENEVGTMGQEADWVDYSGVVADQAVGVTLMHHPSNPRSPYFVRDYGTFLSNFTMNEPYVLRDGKSLLQRFRVLVHEDRAEEVDIVGYHAEFCAA